MLDERVVTFGQTLLELFLSKLDTTGIDETKREEGTSFTVLVGSSTSGKVGLYDAVTVDPASTVNETQSGSCGELGPVGSSAEPVEVLTKELVRCGAAVGKSVGEGDGGVIDGISIFKSFLGDFKY